MENNFHLKSKLYHNDLYIDLHGSFDGSSACELIQTLHDKVKSSTSVFIDTSNLTHAYPFGKAVLTAELPKQRERRRLHFKGHFAKAIMPDGCVLLHSTKRKKHACSGQCENCKCRSKSRLLS